MLDKILQWLAADPGDQPAQHIGIGGVVVERRTGRQRGIGLDKMHQEILHTVNLGVVRLHIRRAGQPGHVEGRGVKTQEVGVGVGVVLLEIDGAAVVQHLLDSHPLETAALQLGNVFYRRGIERHFPLVHQQAEDRADQGLGHRKPDVVAALVELVKIGLMQQATALHYQHAIGVIGLEQCIKADFSALAVREQPLAYFRAQWSGQTANIALPRHHDRIEHRAGIAKRPQAHGVTAVIRHRDLRGTAGRHPLHRRIRRFVRGQAGASDDDGR